MTSPGKANGSLVSSNTECVKVVLRCRPMNEKEKQKGKFKSIWSDIGCAVIVNVDNRMSQILLKKEGSSEIPKTFTYDYCYGMDST